MLTDKFTTLLSKSIIHEYNKLLHAITQVPQKYHAIKSINATGGQVSIRDIIAYQIGWGTLLLSWYNAGIKGKMPAMPGEGFTKWDYVGLAKHFYKKYHYSSLEEQLQYFKELVQEIILIVETEYKTGNLEKLGVWDWGTLKSGKQWPLSKWITINTVAPYERATTLINKFCKHI